VCSAVCTQDFTIQTVSFDLFVSNPEAGCSIPNPLLLLMTVPTCSAFLLVTVAASVQVPDETIMDPIYCAPEQYILPINMPDAPPGPLMSLLAPLLFLAHTPDKFDLFSAGLVLMQLAVPTLRYDRNLVSGGVKNGRGKLPAEHSFFRDGVETELHSSIVYARFRAYTKEGSTSPVLTVVSETGVQLRPHGEENVSNLVLLGSLSYGFL
jgi:hypothetical protein